VTLSAPILNYSNVLAVIFFTAEARRPQRAIIFLFAVERPRWSGMQATANKKAQALRAKHKSDLRIA
jgi:hypothetical protein